MNIKIPIEDLKNKKPSDLVPLECTYCKSEFMEKAGVIKTYKKIGRDTGLQFCSTLCRGKSKKLKIEDVKKIFESRGAELLEDVYKNCITKMKFKCKCGNVHSVNFNNFQQGKDRCPKCALESRAVKRRLTYENVKNLLDKNTDLKLDMTKEEYNNLEIGDRKLKLICEKGHTIYRTTSGLGAKNNCYTCFYENNRGPNHPNWIPDRSDDHRLHRNNYKTLDIEWKKKVIKRDNYKCVLCGSKKKIIGHHLNGYHWDKENRYNVDNGVTVCLEHHKEFHKKYKSKWNTKEQFEEFKQEKRAETNPLLMELEIAVYD